MASRNHSIASDVPKLSVADTARHDALDQINGINESLTAAGAIIDCVRVLSALERTVRVPRECGEMAMGAGYADGEKVRDASISAVLFHVMQLLEGVNTSAGVLFDLSKGGK